MLGVLSNRTYRHLFAAQVIALVGTGLATVALGLLAWDLAGGDAAQVLGTALAIKMVAYVTLSPVAQAFADRVSRRTLLVTLDLVRAGVALALPFVSEIWQIYALIFLLQGGPPPASLRRSRRPFRTCCPTRRTTPRRCRCRAWPMTLKPCCRRCWRPRF